MKCKQCGEEGAKNKAYHAHLVVAYCNSCAGVTAPYDRRWKDKLRFEERTNG